MIATIMMMLAMMMVVVVLLSSAFVVMRPAAHREHYCVLEAGAGWSCVSLFSFAIAVVDVVAAAAAADSHTNCRVGFQRVEGGMSF